MPCLRDWGFSLGLGAFRDSGGSGDSGKKGWRVWDVWVCSRWEVLCRFPGFCKSDLTDQGLL